jgi:hypothetical protein
VAAVLLAVLAAGEVLRRSALRALEPDRRESAVTTYAWHGSGIAPLDRVVRPLIWRDRRIDGRWYPQLTHYLWHESQWFESADRLAAEVRNRTTERDTIFGDSASTPLIALLAGRRIALDEADTNVMGFLLRPQSGEDLIRRLDGAPPEIVVARANFGIFSMRFFQAWARRNYAVALESPESVFGKYLLLTRRPVPAE